MQCNKCRKSANSIRWHRISVNGKYHSSGEIASKQKRDRAVWMKQNGWKKDQIEYWSYNYCFECGHKNNLVKETIVL